MEVNNKYQIGEKVFFLDQNEKAVCDVVKAVSVFMRNDSTKISYDMEKAPTYLPEDRVFATEADLKQHVFGDLIEFV